jgi:hypothetical protein
VGTAERVVASVGLRYRRGVSRRSQASRQENRAAWRAEMDEFDECIKANADEEELVNQPDMDRKITRVGGPFSVGAVQPSDMSLSDAVNTGEFDGAPKNLEGACVVPEVQMGDSAQTPEATLGDSSSAISSVRQRI